MIIITVIRKVLLLITFVFIVFFIIKCSKPNSEETKVIQIISPEITSISPNYGNIGDIITIIGTNFQATSGNNNVKIKNTVLSLFDYVSWSNNQIKFKIPIKSESGLLRIIHSEGESNSKNIYIATHSFIDLKANETDGISKYENSYVSVIGILIHSDDLFTTSKTRLYLKKNNYGSHVYYTGGIFNASKGDLIYTEGTINTFYGLTQVVMSSLNNIKILSSNNIENAVNVTIANLNENYESTLIKINNVNISSGSWPSVIISDGTGTLKLKIEANAGLTEPSWSIDITGIYSQYDSSSPYDSGYQIIPRKQTDFQ